MSAACVNQKADIRYKQHHILIHPSTHASHLEVVPRARHVPADQLLPKMRALPLLVQVPLAQLLLFFFCFVLGVLVCLVWDGWIRSSSTLSPPSLHSAERLTCGSSWSAAARWSIIASVITMPC